MQTLLHSTGSLRVSDAVRRELLARAESERFPERYQHAADIRADLKRLKRDTESGHALTVDEQTSPPKRSASGKMIAGLATAVVILAAAIGVAFP